MSPGREPKAAATSEVPPATRDRLAEVRRLVDEMEAAEQISEGQFNAMGMLVTDASLAADEPALAAVQDGLQWIYSGQGELAAADADQIEQRGRLLGMIDVTHWALRRLPSTLQVRLDPSSHAGRFLLAVADRPGLSNQELASRLGIDETEASRVGRRLLAAGVVWRRKEWKRNAWDITPRGTKYLASIGLAEEASEAPEPEAAAGVKMLPRRLVGMVIDADAQELASAERRFESVTEPSQQVRQVADLTRELIAKAHAENEYVPDRIALGVEVGGHVSTHTGRVVFAPSYGPSGAWEDYPLRDALQDATTLPTVIENDANALAEHEYVFGHGKGTDTFAVVVLDEGIGCGLIVHRRLTYGVHAMAGEIGHIVVQPDGRECRCGNKGCLESMAGTLAVTQIFAELTGRDAPKEPNLPGLAFNFEQDDKDARAAIKQAGDALGRGISAVLNLANPQKLVLYGPAELVCESRYAPAELFMKKVRESSERYTFSTAGQDCTIIPKTFDYWVGARAAAAAALLHAEQRPR
jgi:predicted NBD/HSP70 family sugar kinase